MEELLEEDEVPVSLWVDTGRMTRAKLLKLRQEQGLSVPSNSSRGQGQISSATGSQGPNEVGLGSRSGIKSERKKTKSGTSVPQQQEEFPEDEKQTARVRLETNQRKIFENCIIVGMICSFSSEADIRNFRLVSHLFQREATKRFRMIHKHVSISTEKDFKKFTSEMRKRKSLNLFPLFPFTSFKVDLGLPVNVIQRIGTTIGDQVLRYLLEPPSASHEDTLQIGGKVVTLLSHSPQLLEIEMSTFLQVYLPEQDIIRLPPVFPRLSAIHVGYWRNGGIDNPPRPTANPLVHVLVERSRALKSFRIPTLNFRNVDFRDLRNLLVNYRQKLPSSFSHFHWINVGLDDNNIVAELMDMNVCFQSLAIYVATSNLHERNEDEEQRMLDTATVWLEMQASTLLDLSLCVNIAPPVSSFQFPTLLALKNLTIVFPEYLLVPPNSRPVLPFVGNQFPALQKFRLDHYKQNHKIFGTGSMTSVQEFHLYACRTSLRDRSWHTTFPNLTSLNIEFEFKRERFLRTTLVHVLTHFARLVHLKLDFDFKKNSSYWNDECYTSPCSNSNYWDILTGGAPRSVQKKLGLSESVEEAEAEEEPVNGIYQISSLRNMKALRTLSLFPRRKVNLDAIWYMSSKGYLVPLENLSLSRMRCNAALKDDMMTTYNEKFTQIHKKVDMLVLE